MFIQKKFPQLCGNQNLFWSFPCIKKTNKLLNKDPKLTNFRYGKKISDCPLFRNQRLMGQTNIYLTNVKSERVLPAVE